MTVSELAFDPFHDIPRVWPVVFGRASDAEHPAHLTTDAPPIVSRLQCDYRTLCDTTPTQVTAVTYLTGADAVMLAVADAVPGGHPMCQECLAAWERLVDDVVS